MYGEQAHIHVGAQHNDVYFVFVFVFVFSSSNEVIMI